MTIKLAGAALAVILSATTSHARNYDLPQFDRHSVRDYIAPSTAYRARISRRHARAHHVTHFTVRAVLFISRRPVRDLNVIPMPRPRPKSEPKSDLTLIEKARLYLGTNPTHWRSLWCAHFLAMIAPKAARRLRNPNLAREWARLPHVEPRVGAIVVLARGGGGHVGIVTGFKHGNPVVISGNHGHKVGIGTYDRRRVIAFVSAT